MIDRTPMVITSVEPMEGREGTVVTLKGSGFAPHVRNNCIVVGGMGACARAEPETTPNELKVRVGPVARETEGDILAWPGLGLDLHTERISFGDTALNFLETAIFRNGAPVASAGIKFKLIGASANTYAGSFERSRTRVELGGHEAGSVMRMILPNDISFEELSMVDICLVLKEPTLAIDFTAEISGRRGFEECIRVLAKSIVVSASLVGEKVFADVARDQDTGELELYVTKPYLQNGMFTVSFNSSRAVAASR